MIKSTAQSDDGVYLRCRYNYRTSRVISNTMDETVTVTPHESAMSIRVKKALPKLGVLIAGLGGNNGTTLVGMLIANKLEMTWRTKRGIQSANYYGSLTQCSTTWLGLDEATLEPVYVPFFSLLPMVHPSDIVIGGWDINKLDLGRAMARAEVFEPELQDQLKTTMGKMHPRPAAFDASFVAINQEGRVDNLIGGTKAQQVMQLRADIHDFRDAHQLDKVIVMWMGNTERFCQVRKGLNSSAEELMLSLQRNEPEISSSTLYGIAAVLENCPFINGSPQNTFVPGLIEMARMNKVPIVGDDLKTGQTKVKSVLVDFLVSAGIKPRSIVSYNHLGNNDGLNLSEEIQFRSKEITKSSVIYDSVMNNSILYPDMTSPDHCIVIKYVPEVGDSKRAMDEYVSEIGMGGRNTIIVHNTCEDSLLASSVILDLIILTELFSRIEFKVTEKSADTGDDAYEYMDEVLSVLSYLCKAPLLPQGASVVNALFAQRSCIENVLRAAIGLDPINHMNLEYKLKAFLSARSISDNGHTNTMG